MLAVLGTMLLFLLLVGAMYAFARIPQPSDITRVQSVRVVDHDGKEVGRIRAAADRVSIPLKDMPEDLRHAVIATEDRHFYQHRGVQLTSIVRAAIANVFGGGVRQGGSTITQQYVKNAFVGNERSIFRKVKEAVLAIKFERKRSKNQILEDYLNTIYFGRGAYGVEAAAAAFFGKHAKELTLPQAALLAGIIRSPSSYDPIRDSDAAKQRRNQVLGFMVRDRYVSQDEADRAARTKVRTATSVQQAGLAPHYLDDVRRFLEDKIGSRRLFAGGLTVTASLDADMQRAAEDAVTQVYDRKSDPDAALVAIDPSDGAVRAMVGSRSYAKLQLNVAMHAHRQPGSTFKPATLATYVDEGYSIRDEFRAPATITIPGARPVSNYDHQDHGKLTVEEATWDSVNTVYMQMIKKAGASKVASMGADLGIESTLDPVLGLALGVSGVTPLELTDMYATFAARGVHHTPYLVEKVTDTKGRILFEQKPERDRAIEENVADTVNRVLQGVIRKGTGRPAQIGRPAAGKTGTTNELKDAWFAGYTPDLVAVVWNGFDTPKPLYNVHGLPKVFGGTFPAQMWTRFMLRALAGTPASDFHEPSDIPSPSTSASTSSSPSGKPSPTKVPTGSTEPSVTPSPSPSKSSKPKPSKSASPSPTPTVSST